MNQANHYIEVLNQEYLKRVKQNPSYSKRAFSKLLDISPGALSEILNSKRALSKKAVLKISKKLDFNPEETQEFLRLVLTPDTIKKHEITEIEISDLDMFYVISEWYCTAILNLVYLKNFSWNVAWISKKLNISKTEVQTALEKLQAVGLIKRSQDGFELVSEHIQTSKDIPSQAIKNFHSSILKKIENSMLFHNIHQREVSGITFNVNQEDLPHIKKEINDFQTFLANKYNRNPSDDIYHLETCFLKLTEEV